MTEKKTKLTISGNTKKSFVNTNIPKVKGKNTFEVENKGDKNLNTYKPNKTFGTKTSFNHKKTTLNKNIFSSRLSSTITDFERRKLAEQRATKRLKDDGESKEDFEFQNEFNYLWLFYCSNFLLNVFVNKHFIKLLLTTYLIWLFSLLSEFSKLFKVHSTFFKRVSISTIKA